MPPEKESMDVSMETIPHYPTVPEHDDAEMHRLLEDAIDFAHSCGMVMRTAEMKDRSDLCQTAPFALLPSPFPRRLFQEAVDIQQAMALLYFRVSWDYDFLIESHSKVVKTDDFTRGLVNILKAVHDEGIKQTKVLLIQRSDYMCHNEGDGKPYKLRQVEVNNIAASMGSLGDRATEMHKRVLQDLGVPADVIETALPPNGSVDTIARGIFEAWNDSKDRASLILFVVEDVNQNQLDQRHVEFAVDKLSERKAKCARATLTECAKRLSLGGEDGYTLLLDGTQRVSVAYFRAGYSPDNYGEIEWAARLLIERSNAVKCPWIGLQLANTKKIQQVLSCEGEVERYFPNEPQVCKQIRATFAGLWGLDKDDQETVAILKKALERPEDFVLKPQLEGGGGNYYGAEVATMLRSMNAEQRAAHILMERIKPMVVKNFLVRAMQPVSMVNAVGELGIYGYLYGEGSFGKNEPRERVITNYNHGHIIRTKAENVDKGGVAVGAAVIDSPFLF